MSKNVVPMDNLDWAIQLGCPPSACTNAVKEILNRGISSYVWDEISSKIYSTNDVTETRKNILLHYLKNQVSVTSIQSMKNTKRLRAERRIVGSQIENKLAEYMEMDTSLRKKGLKLAEVQSQKKTVQLKKNVLQLKCQETKAGIVDFEEMFLVCQTLLPSSRFDIDESIMQESLALAGAIASRADKREALKQLSQNFGSASISELWSWILNKRVCDTEKLVNHGFQYELSKAPKQQNGQRLDIGIAKACGQHMINTTARLIHLKKGDTERTRGIHYMEKIETSMNDDANETIQDWLTVAVEIAQLEENHKVMQSEIDIIKTATKEADNLRARHLQLASEIHEINVLMEECGNKIQQALMKFEPTGQSLTILKSQLAIALSMIAALNFQSNIEWQGSNLIPEVEVFQENLNINALNKVLLSGKVGAYRHASTCMSNALINSHVFASSSPVYRTPLIHLVYCFENLIANSALKSQQDDSDVAQHLENNSRAICAPSIREIDTLDLLHSINTACEKCQNEIKIFDSVYDSWVYQFVNEVMATNENTVHGATYDEWMQRFTTLAYMIHRNK